MEDHGALDDIQVFAKVVQEGSFVGASKALGLPRSTVSRRIAKLEKHLGARLLQRTTRQLHLTEVGEIYFDYATSIMAQIEEAKHAVSQLQSSPRGTLRITVPMNFGYLGSFVADFLESYPEVHIEIVSTDRVVDIVSEGFDLAIRVGPLSDSTLIARNLGGLKTALVASPAYLENYGHPESPDDLVNMHGLIFSGGSRRREWQLQRDSEIIEVRCAPRIYANDMDYIRHCAVAGLGIAMLSLQDYYQDFEQGKLVQILPEWSPPPVNFHAVYPSAKLVTPKLRVFVEHLREHLSSKDPH